MQEEGSGIKGGGLVEKEGRQANRTEVGNYKKGKRGGGRARRMVTGHAALNRTELLGSSLLCSGLAWHKTLAQCTSRNTLHVRHT